MPIIDLQILNNNAKNSYCPPMGHNCKTWDKCHIWDGKKKQGFTCLVNETKRSLR